MIACASVLGVALNKGGKRAGGFNCVTSIWIRLNQTAVNWFCDAKHINSKRGPGWSVRRVVSLGRAVIALTSSLSAYFK